MVVAWLALLILVAAGNIFSLTVAHASPLRARAPAAAARASQTHPQTAPTATADPPTVTCSTSANIFNTGYNSATGGVLANGAHDANWTVAGNYTVTPPTAAAQNPGYFANAGTTPPNLAVYPFTGTTGGLPATQASFIPATVGRVNTAWSTSPFGNANWISPLLVSTQNQSQPTSTGVGDWYFQY